VDVRILHVGMLMLVFKAHRLWYHSTLGLIVIKKKKNVEFVPGFGHGLKDILQTVTNRLLIFVYKYIW